MLLRRRTEPADPRCRFWTGLRPAACVCLALGWLTSSAAAQAPNKTKPADWLAGPTLEAQFAQRVTFNWSNAPLRSVVARMARLQRTALVLDRRMDPEQPLTLSIVDQPLIEACQRVAAAYHIGFCRLGPVGYFGPSEVAARLRTVAALRKEEAQKLPAEQRTRLTATERWHWADFATPRELIAELSQNSGVRIVGQEQIPHDLWVEGDLPALSWIDRLTLLLAQFDLTFRFEDDGQVVQVVPMPTSVVLERTYPGGSQPAELARRWAAHVPTSQVEVVGNRIVVRGPVEDHDRVKELGTAKEPKQKAPVKGSAAPQKVYTLQLVNVPLRRLLPSLAKQLEVEFVIDDAVEKAGISLEQNVAIDVDRVPLDELLKAALGPAKLTYRREGNRIIVVPAKG